MHLAFIGRTTRIGSIATRARAADPRQESLAVFASSALVQSLAQQLVGTWKITSGVVQVGDETKLTPLGADLIGMMIYTLDGHFCFTAMSAIEVRETG